MRVFFLLMFVSLSILGEDKKVIRIFTALCDNDHQGIVKVPKKLGDGDDPTNNLYWGAAYGIKTWFKKSKEWELLSSDKVNDIILERLIFLHKDKKTYLVADAYRGREMKACLTDYFSCLAGVLKNDDHLTGKGFLMGQTKLAVFVGHNGLMDFKLIQPQGKGKIDAMSFCCKSRSFFEKEIKNKDCRPLLLTNGFMAPEAYSVSASIEGWLAGNTAEGIVRRAASAYQKYQKCSHKAAYNLFKP